MLNELQTDWNVLLMAFQIIIDTIKWHNNGLK